MYVYGTVPAEPLQNGRDPGGRSTGISLRMTSRPLWIRRESGRWTILDIDEVPCRHVLSETADRREKFKEYYHIARSLKRKNIKTFRIKCTSCGRDIVPNKWAVCFFGFCDAAFRISFPFYILQLVRWEYVGKEFAAHTGILFIINLIFYFHTKNIILSMIMIKTRWKQICEKNEISEFMQKNYDTGACVALSLLLATILYIFKIYKII